MINKFFPINFPWQVIIARVYGWASFPWRQRSRSSLNAGTGIDFMTCLGARTILVHNNFIWFLRKFQSQSCIKVICFPPTRKQQSLGLTLSQWWQVLWILRSFKKLKKIIYTVHSNTIYPWFRSKTKPKLFILHRHRSRCLSSLLYKRSRYAHLCSVHGHLFTSYDFVHMVTYIIHSSYECHLDVWKSLTKCATCCNRTGASCIKLLTTI